MNDFTLILIGLGVVAAIALWVVWFRRGGEIARRTRSVIRWGRRYTNVIPYIYVESGLEPLTNEQIVAVQVGLVNTIERARARGWTKKLRVADYTVVLLKGETYKGNPVLHIDAGRYAGSEYDQGGFIHIAGKAVDAKRCILAIPYHKPDQNEHLEDIVGKEAEHCLAWHNDWELYKKTEFHAPGTGHPIF